MKKKHFGILIKGLKESVFKDVAARLFISPRITTQHASKMLEMLCDKTMSLADFNKKTNAYIEDLTKLKESNSEELHRTMTNKLNSWKKVYDEPTANDYEYLEKKYGLSYKDLYGREMGVDPRVLKSPKSMAEYVKQYVLGHDEAIDQLAVTMYQHLDSKNKKYRSKIKTPILTMGPTGIGKSEIWRIFGKICNCPVVRINSSEIVPTGWKGTTLANILAQELASGIPLEDMKYAIIVIHEFDKITHFDKKIVSSNGSDATTDMMRDIMRLFETEHSLHLEYGMNPHNMTPRTFKLPVDNLLVVFDGAFHNIEKLIKKRLYIGSNLGYDLEKQHKYANMNFQRFTTNEDLIKWGYMPELLGRIGQIVVLDPLSADTIYKIMTCAKDNVVDAHYDFCAKNNIDLHFTEDGLRFIAQEAYKSGLGFRNVKTLLSMAMQKPYFNLLGNDDTSDRKVVMDREEVIKQLQFKSKKI